MFEYIQLPREWCHRSTETQSLHKNCDTHELWTITLYCQSTSVCTMWPELQWTLPCQVLVIYCLLAGMKNHTFTVRIARKDLPPRETKLDFPTACLCGLDIHLEMSCTWIGKTEHFVQFLLCWKRLVQWHFQLCCAHLPKESSRGFKDWNQGKILPIFCWTDSRDNLKI